MRPQPGPKPDTTLLLKSARHGVNSIHQQQQQQLGHDSGGGGGVGKRPGLRSGSTQSHVTDGRYADGDSGAAHPKVVAGSGNNNRAGAWLLESPASRLKYGRDR